MNISRGTRLRLTDSFRVSEPMNLRISVDGTAEYDISCFGVDQNDKLSDDRYMVFYNQTASPDREITMHADAVKTVFTMSLDALPMTITKLVFTISIDGTETMSSLRSCVIAVEQAGAEPICLPLTGADFSSERAIVAVEIYRKDVWRLCAVASGFNGGLSDLLKAYGGEEADAAPAPMPAPASAPTPAPRTSGMDMIQPITPPVLEDLGAPAPTPVGANPTGKKISLEKKLSAEPKLISLAKPIQIVLEKKKLNDTTARVALVLDMSGSMMQRYKDGTVQSIVKKMLPLAVQFDNDGSLDFWLYGSLPRRMPAVTMKNFEFAVPMPFEQTMFDLGYGNNEPDVMRQVIDEYRNSDLPAYVIFITDGDIKLERDIKNLLTDSSRLPIFWQFVGVGGKNYGVLQRLDAMQGRYVDNAGFFALDDFQRVPNDTLYDRLLSQFPQWLNTIRGDAAFPQIR
ncbi:MAG: VWA domain-containing protein [Ruminococcus sp.]|nr:VWA domain-containing protein [Ruminococcus sp.]